MKMAEGDYHSVAHSVLMSDIFIRRTVTFEFVHDNARLPTNNLLQRARKRRGARWQTDNHLMKQPTLPRRSITPPSSSTKPTATNTTTKEDLCPSNDIIPKKNTGNNAMTSFSTSSRRAPTRSNSPPIPIIIRKTLGATTEDSSKKKKTKKKKKEDLMKEFHKSWPAPQRQIQRSYSDLSSLTSGTDLSSLTSNSRTFEVPNSKRRPSLNDASSKKHHVSFTMRGNKQRSLRQMLTRLDDDGKQQTESRTTTTRTKAAKKEYRPTTSTSKTTKRTSSTKRQQQKEEDLMKQFNKSWPAPAREAPRRSLSDSSSVLVAVPSNSSSSNNERRVANEVTTTNQASTTTTTTTTTGGNSSTTRRRPNLNDYGVKKHSQSFTLRKQHSTTSSLRNRLTRRLEQRQPVQRHIGRTTSREALLAQAA